MISLRRNGRCSAPPRMGAAEKLDRGQRTDCPRTSNDTETAPRRGRGNPPDYNSKVEERSHHDFDTQIRAHHCGGDLAYLGLAILGWGGFAAFFSHPALVALAIAYFVLFGIALFSGSNLSPGARDDPADRWVVFAFWLIGLLAAYLPAYTDRKGFWILDADRCSLCRQWRVAALARLCARAPLQRAGSYPARA
jgi:hypothetical protein